MENTPVTIQDHWEPHNYRLDHDTLLQAEVEAMFYLHHSREVALLRKNAILNCTNLTWSFILQLKQNTSGQLGNPTICASSDLDPLGEPKCKRSLSSSNLQHSLSSKPMVASQASWPWNPPYFNLTRNIELIKSNNLILKTMVDYLSENHTHIAEKPLTSR